MVERARAYWPVGDARSLLSLGCVVRFRLTMELKSKCEEYALSEDRVEIAILDQVRTYVLEEICADGHHSQRCRVIDIILCIR